MHGKPLADGNPLADKSPLADMKSLVDKTPVADRKPLAGIDYFPDNRSHTYIQLLFLSILFITGPESCVGICYNFVLDLLSYRDPRNEHPIPAT